MKWFAIALTFFLAACSTVEFDEIASAGSATGGCAIGSALGGPAGCAIGGAAAGAATIIVTPKSDPGVDITQVENEHQAAVANNQIFWDFVQTFWIWLLGACVVIVVAAWIIPGPQLWFERRKKDAG